MMLMIVGHFILFWAWTYKICRIASVLISGLVIRLEPH